MRGSWRWKASRVEGAWASFTRGARRFDLGGLAFANTGPTGAAVPNASVTVSGPNNVVKVAQTDASGVYTVAGLPPGKYTVRVIATGFNVFEKTDADYSDELVYCKTFCPLRPSEDGPSACRIQNPSTVSTERALDELN